MTAAWPYTVGPSVAATSQEEGQRERRETLAAISELRDEVWRRLDEVDLRDHTYLQALAELGVDLRDETGS